MTGQVFVVRVEPIICVKGLARLGCISCVLNLVESGSSAKEFFIRTNKFLIELKRRHRIKLGRKSSPVVCRHMGHHH